MSLRRATQADAEIVAQLMRVTTEVSLPFLPDLHTREEDLAFVQTRLMAENAVWISERAGVVEGCIAFNDGWITQLFVHPDHQGRGVGSALLDHAMADGRPRQLWTFQKNERARAFYESRGWRAIRFTDGADNMEREPDVLYASDGRMIASRMGSLT